MLFWRGVCAHARTRGLLNRQCLLTGPRTRAHTSKKSIPKAASRRGPRDAGRGLAGVGRACRPGSGLRGHRWFGDGGLVVDVLEGVVEQFPGLISRGGGVEEDDGEAHAVALGGGD